MKKQYMMLPWLSSAFILFGSSVYGADFRKPLQNPFGPMIKRAQVERKKEIEKAKELYPKEFDAFDIQDIVNAPPKQYSDTTYMRYAVFVDHKKFGRIKVSSKVDNKILNPIKAAIDKSVIEGRIESLSVNDSTRIEVHPHIKAIFKELIQANYGGGTAQEERERTNQSIIGRLAVYTLYLNGEPFKYRLGDSSATKITATLILSITSRE
jgi:hypothetical protein